MGGILEAFLAGKEARRTADAAEQVNAMNAFLAQNGQAIFAGDQNALGQLAGMGPQGLQTALSVKGNLEASADRAYARERDKITDQRADQKWEMELAEYKKSMSAEQAAAEAAQLEEAAKMALTAKSPEEWDMLATQNGAPELVGMFDNREAVAARFMSMAEVLKAQDGGDPADRYKIVGDDLVDLGGPDGPARVDLSGGAPPKVDFKDVADLRKEWIGMPAVKTFQTQSDSLGRIMAANAEPTGAGDVALVYSYMKMLDPGSVVREGEFATAEQTSGLDQQLVGTYNKLVSGERLTPEMRQDFVARALAIYGNAEAEYDALRKQYEGIASRNNFPVEDALPDFRYSGERGSKPPPKSTVIDGYTIEALE